MLLSCPSQKPVSNFSPMGKTVRITVLDETTCNVAAMSVPKYRNDTQILQHENAGDSRGRSNGIGSVFNGSRHQSCLLRRLPARLTWSDVVGEESRSPRRSSQEHGCIRQWHHIRQWKHGQGFAELSRYENGFRIGAKLPKGRRESDLGSAGAIRDSH